MQDFYHQINSLQLQLWTQMKSKNHLNTKALLVFRVHWVQLYNCTANVLFILLSIKKRKLICYRVLNLFGTICSFSKITLLRMSFKTLWVAGIWRSGEHPHQWGPGSIPRLNAILRLSLLLALLSPPRGFSLDTVLQFPIQSGTPDMFEWVVWSSLNFYTRNGNNHNLSKLKALPYRVGMFGMAKGWVF